MSHDPKKSPLYQILNILWDKRLNTRGKDTPVIFKLQDFSPVLQYIDASANKQIEALGSEIRELMNETTGKGSLIFKVQDADVLDSFSKSYRANKEVILFFSRVDIKEYIEYLINGDKIRQGKIKNGLWFNKRTGQMEEGRIPSATQMGQEVRKITVISPEMDGGPISIAINDDYENLIKINSEKKFWKAIVALSNGEILSNMNYKEARYYINYGENKNNIMYKRGHFLPSHIFQFHSGELIPRIEIEKAISIRTYKQRLSRQPKRA